MSFIAGYRKVIISIAAVLAMGVFLFYVFTVPTQQKTQREVIALSHPMKGVTFVASLGNNRIEPETNQKLHMELLQEAATLPATIEVCADLPGKEAVCHTWPSHDGQLDPSMDLQVQAKAGALSQILTVTIKASHWPADSKTAKPLPGAFQRSILRVGPLHIERFSAGTDKFLRGLARLRGLLKDITLPILIPLVGIYFARRASRRAEQDEVRRLLLSKVQGLTKSFYTHLVHHARYAIASLNKGPSDEATFHLLSLLLFNSQLKDEEGGVFSQISLPRGFIKTRSI
jgi:hypothetical protein